MGNCQCFQTAWDRGSKDAKLKAESTMAERLLGQSTGETFTRPSDVHYTKHRNKVFFIVQNHNLKLRHYYAEVSHLTLSPSSVATTAYSVRT